MNRYNGKVILKMGVKCFVRATISVLAMGAIFVCMSLLVELSDVGNRFDEWFAYWEWQRSQTELHKALIELTFAEFHFISTYQKFKILSLCITTTSHFSLSFYLLSECIFKYFSLEDQWNWINRRNNGIDFPLFVMSE